MCSSKILRGDDKTLTLEYESLFCSPRDLIGIDEEQEQKKERQGVDFYISPTGSVERKVLLDALKDLVV